MNKFLYCLLSVALLLIIQIYAESPPASLTLIGPAEPRKAIVSYTLNESERVFKKHGFTIVQGTKGQNTILIGTPENNPQIAHFIKSGFLKPETQPQGYSLKCAPHPDKPDAWLLVIAGADEAGTLYGLRDLEHFEMDHFKVTDDKLTVTPFQRSDYPRIEHRGHWVWGCNMPDKKAWLDNMSRWKLNELIHWDNYPPKKAKEYVDHAHSRGIRVIWGFGWGWEPDWNFDVPKQFNRGVGEGVPMCGSDPFNIKFLRKEILRKVREDYVPTGCDGIYFQAFTEWKKCECPQCKDKSMGEIMLNFVNPLVADIKKEFPDLWISCGIHSNFGKYKELEKLDPRCNIYWENCPSGTSIRGPHEDFGYINKSLPYAHGFSKTCPADPDYTEASLEKWMTSNAHRYAINGDIIAYDNYMKGLQKWSKALLGKPSTNKHATTVADHSVFCRRTPFMHVALAESMWNPDLNTEETVPKIVSFLQDNGGVPGFIKGTTYSNRVAQHDAVDKKIELSTRYSKKYPGGGDDALTDGKRSGAPNYLDTAWQGYEKQNLDVIIDLATPTSINALSTGFLHQPALGISLPEKVEYAISYDGKKYQVIGDAKIPGITEPTNRKKGVRKSIKIEGLDLYKVRYIRVRARNAQDWLFADEIMVNPIGPEE